MSVYVYVYCKHNEQWKLGRWVSLSERHITDLILCCGTQTMQNCRVCCCLLLNGGDEDVVEADSLIFIRVRWSHTQTIWRQVVWLYENELILHTWMIPAICECHWCMALPEANSISVHNFCCLWETCLVCHRLWLHINLKYLRCHVCFNLIESSALFHANAALCQ